MSLYVTCGSLGGGGGVIWKMPLRRKPPNLLLVFCEIIFPLSAFFVEGYKTNCGVARKRLRSFHKHWDITAIPEALSTRVYGLVQRLHLPIPRPPPPLFSWSIPSTPYLLGLHFICSSSLLIFHIFSTQMIPFFFIYPALLKPPPALLTPHPLPPIFLYPHSVSCVPVLSWTPFPSLLLSFCLLFPPFSLISPVTSLLFSYALPCSLFTTHVSPWSLPLSLQFLALLLAQRHNACTHTDTHTLTRVCVHTRSTCSNIAREVERKADHALFAGVNTLPQASAEGNESFHLWDIECAFMESSVHGYCLWECVHVCCCVCHCL